jgi:hypothetical protein
MKTLTKEQKLIKLMIKGWTSSLDGVKYANTIKLTARVSEFKDYFQIKDQWVQKKDKLGNIVRFKEYRIVRPSKKALAVYGL